MEVLRRGRMNTTVFFAENPKSELTPLYISSGYVMRTHYNKYHIWYNMGSHLCACCDKVEWKYTVDYFN